jgi:hypothetical protein
MTRPLAGEREGGVPVAKGIERLDQDNQGLLLDVDDALSAADPAIGRGADVDQQRDGQITACGSRRGVEAIVARTVRALVREGRDVRGEIEIRPIGLVARSRAAGAQPVEAPSDVAHQGPVAGHHLLDPRRRAGESDARPDDRPRAP